MSRLGLLLCVPYAIFIVVCVCIVSLAGADETSQFVFLQLPLAGQIALVDALGMGRVFEFVSWPDAYGLFVPPVFIVLYTVGALLERGLERRRGLGPATVDGVL